ncbi:MAG: GntR family transcriptional regulator [Rhodobacteraceae bacterium]|nr:GntR family transcriptional regulator [Paracoccaceae bacterium]
MKMTERAYQDLRDAIISLRIRPGERLDIDRISASLGFSRAPVIEALNMLRTEGLVVSRRRVGTFASEIGRDQIEEVFDAREMIEQRVAPLVIHNISDRQIDALGNILRDAAGLLHEPEATFDYAKFMELDALFHSEIIRLSERKIYQKWFDQLAAHMQRGRYLFSGNALKRSIEGQREHDAILAGLRKRNVASLRDRLLNHTRRSRSGAAEILDQQ